MAVEGRHVEGNLTGHIVIVGRHVFNINRPLIAQLVERRTVESLGDILRSLVRIRLDGENLLPQQMNELNRAFRPQDFIGDRARP